MKFYLVILVSFSGFAHAQSDTEISRNLSARPIRFDSAFDLSQNDGMAVFSHSERIYAKVDCSQNPTSNFKPYLSLSVFSRYGTLLSNGWMYTDSYSDCKQLKIDIFDNPGAYEFSFGPINRWDNREMKVTKDKAK